jgi:FlaA1/EpsC-like NDP-sugar epimerase
MTRYARAVYTRPTQMAIDAACAVTALWLAYVIRFDGVVPAAELRQFTTIVAFVAALYVGCNQMLSLYKRVWRFFNLHDACDLAISVSLTSAVLLWWRFSGPPAWTRGPIPTGVLLMSPFFTYAGWCGARLTRRLLYHRFHVMANTASRSDAGSARRRVALVGAGEAGLYLLREIRKTDVDIIGFLDDDPALQGRSIGGQRVLGTVSELEAVVEAGRVDEVILCLPSAPKTTVQQIAARCARIPVATSSVPDLTDILSGQALINQLRPVTMEDLLGRARITQSAHMADVLRVYGGRRILVTGAGGSIGSELVRQLRTYQPSQLILLDKDENNLYETACEVREDFADVTEVVADVRDRELMVQVFADCMPEIVFHAAAYKHVPLMEHHPAEAILNNVVGTRNLAEISNATGVEMFLMVSTDKAVNPTSIMGASKRVAEMIVQGLAAGRTQTRFCCVRFGNVLGSRASVVPLFQRQIRQRRVITVTHPDVCRYFMTIPEAVQLIIKAGSFGDYGEILMLDMGNPVKIVDLARNLIELSGLEPDKDVRIEFTGLRPGEKLNEELIAPEEHGERNEAYSKIFMVKGRTRSLPELDAALVPLLEAARARDGARIRECLRALGIGYHKDDTEDREPVGIPVRSVRMMPSSATI